MPKNLLPQKYLRKVTFSLTVNEVNGILKHHPRLPLYPNTLLNGYHDSVARSDADSISVRLVPSESAPVFAVLKSNCRWE